MQKAKRPRDEGKIEVEANDTKQRSRGRETALHVRAEKVLQRKCLQNAMKMKSSLRRRNELTKEKIALLAYRKEEFETQKDLEDRPQFLRLFRKQRLLALSQRISGNERNTMRSRLKLCDTSSGTMNEAAANDSPEVKGADHHELEFLPKWFDVPSPCKH